MCQSPSICIKLWGVAGVTHIEGNTGHPTIKKKNGTSRGKTNGLGFAPASTKIWTPISALKTHNFMSKSKRWPELPLSTVGIFCIICIREISSPWNVFFIFANRVSKMPLQRRCEIVRVCLAQLWPECNYQRGGSPTEVIAQNCLLLKKFW